MSNYNLYTILPIKVGCTEEEIDKAYKKYKRLNVSDVNLSREVEKILDEEYALLKQIGLKEYNKIISSKNRKKMPENGIQESMDKMLELTETSPSQHAIDYERNFMINDEVEFDKSKVSNVNNKAIKRLSKKFMLVTTTAVVVIASVVGVKLWNANKDSEPMYTDDSTSISIENEPEMYTFQYIVQHGDTYTGLLEKFNLWTSDANKGEPTLYVGEVLTFSTLDKDLADEWQRIYDINTAKPVMVEWEDYVVQKGDTPMSIASSFGISVQTLMDFNESKVPDVSTVYVGDTIKIPTKILYGEDAYNYNQSQKVESGSMKAVG